MRIGLGQDLMNDVISQACVVAATDPASGDTIASCGGTAPAGSNPSQFVPIVQNGLTIGYSATGNLPAAPSSNIGMYLGIGAGVLLLALVMRRR